MPQILSELKLDEVSLVDRPANSTVDSKGKKTPRAVIALYKRDVEKEITVSGEGGGVEKEINLMKGAAGVQFVLGFPKDGSGSKVQSVIFDKKTWDEDKARAWLNDHDMKSGKVDSTSNTLRFRQEDPAGFSRFRVIQPGQTQKGISQATRVPGMHIATKDEKKRKDISVVEGKHDYGPDDKDLWKEKRKGDEPMTLEELEAQVSKQDETIAAITKRNEELDAENALIIKMSKGERKLYAGMDDDARKAFMAADTKKRGGMMIEAKRKRREKKLTDSMDEACKAEFDAAGPIQKAAMLERQEEILERASNGGYVAKGEKKAAAKAKAHDSEDDGDDGDDGDDEDDEDDGKEKRKTEKLQKRLLAYEDRIAKSESELDAIRKRERSGHFVKRAESELPNTPGSPVEKGSMLEKLADTFGEDSNEFKKMLGNLKSADKVLESQFSEIGKAARGDVPALAAFDAKVEEIAKRDKIDKPHAVGKAMEEAPELYLDYERSQRAAVARA